MKSRKNLVDQIYESYSLEKIRYDQTQLGPSIVHRIFEDMTGDKAQPMKGRAWHLRTIIKNLDTEVRKNMYSNTAQLPQDALAELHTYTQQQQPA